MPFDPNDPNNPNPDPTPPLPPAPDTSQLPDQSPQNQFSMQQANAAMTPQVGPPVAGTKDGIKSLLTGIVGGMGRAMMVNAGLPTPEQQQQKQQQLAMQRQLDQSTIQYHQALAKNLNDQNELVPIQQPPNADGTPQEPLYVARRSQATILNKQAQLSQAAQFQALNSQLKARGIGGQIVQNPTTGQMEFQPITDPSKLTLPQQATIDQKTQEKTPTEIGLEIMRDKGDPAATRILQRRHEEREAERAAFPLNRPGGYVDPNTGQLMTATGGTAIAQGLVPAAPGMQAMSKQAQFGEMKSASSKLKDAITNLDRDFTPAQIAKLQLASRAPDESVLRSIIDSTLGTEQLTAAQQDLVIWQGQMMERLLSLRNVAGMGQGSQDLRAAIQATLPNFKVGSKEFALKKMAAVDNQIQMLEQGIPKFRTGGSAAGGTIRVQLPDGRTGTVPASSRKKYESMPGAKILP